MISGIQEPRNSTPEAKELLRLLNDRLRRCVSDLEMRDAIAKAVKAIKQGEDEGPVRTSGTLATIPAVASELDTFYATDYEHLYEWYGGSWHFHPSDPGSGYIVLAGPMSPNGGEWAICDGSTVNVATSNGSTTSVTTPDLTGDTFIYGGAYSGTVQAATQPKWFAAAKTDNNAAGVEVQAGTGVWAATPFHYHALTDGNAIILPPSETDGGLPKRMGLNFYMRR